MENENTAKKEIDNYKNQKLTNQFRNFKIETMDNAKANTETPKTITLALENLEKVCAGLNETASLSRQVRDIFDRTDDEPQKTMAERSEDNPKRPNMIDVINKMASDIHSKKVFIHENLFYLKNKLK